MSEETLIPDELESKWNEFFQDEIEKERWKANFQKEGPEVAVQYKTLLPNLEPSIANYYHKMGMDAYAIQDWMDQGFSDYKEILQWHKNEANPEIAISFKAKGITPETYLKWSKMGICDVESMLYFYEKHKLDPEDIEKYIKPHVDIGKFEYFNLPNWLELEIPIEEVGEWLKRGFELPEEVFGWKALKLDASDAKKWKEVCGTPEAALPWIIGGYDDIINVKNFIVAGYNTPEELNQAIGNLDVKMEV